MRSSLGRVFQEVRDEIDESWTHGALVGGIASASDEVEFARGLTRRRQRSSSIRH